MQSKTIHPIKSLYGEIEVPGDKSISHRALIFSALALGTSRINNLLLGDDAMSTMRILQQLGIRMSHLPGHLKQGDILEIEGNGLHGLTATNDVLDCGNSGTTMRLMMGLLSAQNFCSRLTGDESLNRRPMDRVIDPLSLMGAKFEVSFEDSQRVITIFGTKKLKSIHYQLPVASAQLKSAILLAGLYAQPKTTLIEPAQTRDHTERMLQAMGATLIQNKLQTIIQPAKELKSINATVPGDFSSAAFFIAAALMIPDSKLILKKVGLNPSRTALLEVLKSMGAKIEIKNECLISGEPIGDLIVQTSRLCGYHLRGNLISNMIDEIPIFAVLAAAANGISEVSDAKELRVKESDRIATIVCELKKLGVTIFEKPDGFVIEGGRPFQGSNFDSHGDHRIAMSLSIAALMMKQPALIQNTDCVATSFPTFFDLLESL